MNLSYGAVESAAKAVKKAENLIFDLEDTLADEEESYIEAVNALKQKYIVLEQSLTDAHASKVNALESALSESSLKLLNADDQYEAVVAQVRDELGVEVDG